MHEPGDEFWLWSSVSLVERIPQLEVVRLSGWQDVQLRMSVEHSIPDLRDRHGCAHYPNRSDFIACTKNKFVGHLKAMANCWAPEYEFFIGRDQLPGPLPDCHAIGSQSNSFVRFFRGLNSVRRSINSSD